jgi:hypothetical protein
MISPLTFHMSAYRINLVLIDLLHDDYALQDNVSAIVHLGHSLSLANRYTKSLLYHACSSQHANSQSVMYTKLYIEMNQ